MGQGDPIYGAKAPFQRTPRLQFEDLFTMFKWIGEGYPLKSILKDIRPLPYD